MKTKIDFYFYFVISSLQLKGLWGQAYDNNNNV
jgi:hypothetical protein